MSTLTQDDTKLLDSQTISTLAAWHCELNSWGWPKQILDPEPKDISITAIRYGRRTAMMHYIADKIGTKEVLRCWHEIQGLPERYGHSFEWWWFKGRYLNKSNAEMKETRGR